MQKWQINTGNNKFTTVFEILSLRVLEHFTAMLRKK